MSAGGTEIRPVKIVFKYLHFTDTTFQSLSLLRPPCSHLHLCLSFRVPFCLLAEITHPEQPPTPRKESIVKLLSSFDGTIHKEFLLTTKTQQKSFSLIEPSSESSCGDFNCLFQPSFNYRQFPFNYDVLLTLTPPRGEKGVKITQGPPQKIEAPHFPVLCKMAPSIKLAVRQARDREASWWEDVMS